MKNGSEVTATKVPEMTLRSSPGGRLMPVIGMGTSVNPLDAEALKSAVIDAIKLGYRHFDTATLYRSEQPLGEAIAEALRLGLVNSRDQLFVTSKLWCTDAHPHLVIPALQNSLRNLQLEYLDLYLIHWPISAKPGKCVWAIDKNELLPMNFRSVWAAMEECQRLGLTKSIGVSNFSCKKLQDLISFAAIPPAVNQVELSPLWQQKKLIEVCKANAIVVTAYSPLGAKGTPWGTDLVMDCDELNQIAAARGKTVAQVTLRWVLELGVSLVVKSFNKERLRENLQIFDWALSNDDYEQINKIPQRRLIPTLAFISPQGPFKTLEELWDGEV